jgi:hypothetical protein
MMWQGMTTDVAGDVAFFYWHILGESVGDTWHLIGKWDGATWPSHGLPCGTLLLVWVLFKILYSPPDSNRGRPHRPSTLTKSARPLYHALVLIRYMAKYIFEFDLKLMWQGVGLGLSPSPQLYHSYHMTITFMHARKHIMVVLCVLYDHW